jgi:hypothetical protein
MIEIKNLELFLMRLHGDHPEPTNTARTTVETLPSPLQIGKMVFVNTPEEKVI